ncbi:MAG TPA: ABC transporter permease, partial [Isosphaeraceae bacterium]|nr:ABC transporter permease [Isosphaeraceae bacterium]
GVEWYLQGTDWLDDQQRALLTITSPFSAALSVPMHTLRNEAIGNQPLAVSDSVLIPITRSIKLPIWSIFLGIYPLVSALFFWITYLAFRWRWWRAGGLG